MSATNGSTAGVETRYLPSLSLDASYSPSSVAGLTGHKDSWRIGIGLSWALLDGVLREARLGLPLAAGPPPRTRREGGRRLRSEKNRRGDLRWLTDADRSCQEGGHESRTKDRDTC